MNHAGKAAFFVVKDYKLLLKLKKNMLLELKLINILSYTANIVFITWGVTAFFKDRVRNKQLANLFNSAYEMSDRLTKSLEEKHSKAQAEDIASFLKSATRNFMNRRFNKVGGESHNIVCRFLEKKLSKNNQNKRSKI